eukprot:9386560-Alexandrium_andersonii.AAC.1
MPPEHAHASMHASTCALSQHGVHRHNRACLVLRNGARVCACDKVRSQRAGRHVCALTSKAVGVEVRRGSCWFGTSAAADDDADADADAGGGVNDDDGGDDVADAGAGASADAGPYADAEADLTVMRQNNTLPCVRTCDDQVGLGKFRFE